MRFKSFRVAPPLAAALFLGAPIFAGCGGSSAGKAPDQVVGGHGFTFAAPAGWQVENGGRQVTATKGNELLQVATFPLQKPYSDALFTRVERELRARMTEVASETKGTVSGSSAVTVAGVRSHSYDVTAGDHVDRYTFVLRGMREFQLLCRRASSSSDDACTQLTSTFRFG